MERAAVAIRHVILSISIAALVEHTASIHVVPIDTHAVNTHEVFGADTNGLDHSSGNASAAITWRLGGDGESCNEVCGGAGLICNEDAIIDINTEEKLDAAAEQVSIVCEKVYIWSELFPSVDTAASTCAYHHVDTTTQTVCDLSSFPDTHLNRLCACEKDAGASASGDPHLVNILGQKFDIHREGVNTFLVFPRARPRDIESRVQLRVDASVTHSKRAGRCNGWYVTQVWVNGFLTGDEITITTRGAHENARGALEVRIGRRLVANTTRFIARRMYNLTVADLRAPQAKAHLHHRLKFAELKMSVHGGPALEFSWFAGKRATNNLNIKVSRLGLLGKDWGGLLGADDSLWSSSFDSRCISHDPYKQLPQMLFNANPDVMASAALT